MKNTNNNDVKNAKVGTTGGETNGAKNVKNGKNCGGKCGKSTKDCK